MKPCPAECRSTARLERQHERSASGLTPPERTKLDNGPKRSKRRDRVA